MMKTRIALAVVALTMLGLSPAMAKDPLKVYILAGQSNMEGQAHPRTIDAMRGDPEVADLYKDMTDKDGTSVTVEDVHIVFGDRSGKLDATFGSSWKGPKIGSEYAFGITMHKLTKEPILLIKTAWGGKNLLQHFRPPSAGDYTKEVDGNGNKTGHFYHEIVKEVKNVLADPGKYHPAYDKQAGFEIAGFVWFQGFNDYIEHYPNLNPDAKSSVKDYSEYSRLLACFIRDIRKDLSAPAMKFVIGAIGIDGVLATEYTGVPRCKGADLVMLQRAQAAPAAMPEFKDNVSVVYTAKYWDHALAAVALKVKMCQKKAAGRGKKGEELYKAANLTAEEQVLIAGQSNEAFHYLGSAKIYSRIGKAFAEAMVAFDKK